MKHKILERALLAALCSFTFAQPVYAGFGDVGIAAKGSTLGYGADITIGLTPSLNVRSGFNTFSYSSNLNLRRNAIDYNPGIKLQSAPLLLDWHPFEKKRFRITTGVVLNKNKITLTSSPSGTTYMVGDGNFDVTQVGSLTGNITFEKSSPYIGFGWGNSISKNESVSYSFDAGIMLHGVPKVSLVANGPIASDADFQNQLEKELLVMTNSTDRLKYYPVISLGVGIKLW